MKSIKEKLENESQSSCLGAAISRFLYEMSKKHNLPVEDIAIGIEEFHPRRDDGKVMLVVYNSDFDNLDGFLSENGL